MMEIKFRQASLEDLPTLYKFEQAIIAAERPFDPTLKPDPINYYDLREMIQSRNTEVIVGVFKDEIICSAYVSLNDSKSYLKHEKYAYLGFMYVKPEFRGKGINQKIMGELKEWALVKGVNEVRLDVYNDNNSAIRAYEKAGFNKHLIEMRMKIEGI
ncbi:GNAT family N-acetyltransferase [Xanthovirga aplysinae]|uniref:GNAT family N-acetyltransferase n=1 Tax=Xanthovirga aplysinae TaxID=2529853 RepID=UPI0012BB7C7F|nr:GNAT family N-acetyltransferase [Xanthovirga aplysinae]MTI29323.1 GNAT family N-acetyltransferase [Xanthovirga aplysinae]